MARLVTILGFVCSFFAAAALQAATFTVTTTADSGPGSLRQAILDANANGSGVQDVINFNIAGAGVQTIALAGPLPNVTTPVLIDGYSQPGASVNTLTFDNGNNAVILISLDGGGVGFYALQFDAGAIGSTVRGLNLQRFSTAISLNGVQSVTVVGNFIGTDASGTIARTNGIGVLLMTGANNNRIGDMPPAQRNLISGNDVGVYHGPGTLFNLTEGNYIGTDVSGMTALGNFTAVWVEGTGNLVRNNLISGATGLPDSAAILLLESANDTEITLNRIGTQRTGIGSIPNQYGILAKPGVAVAPSGNVIGTQNAPNVIANSLLDGVSLRLSAPPPVNNAILYNTFRNNTGLGIDLNDDGVTPNDALDADTGANQLQNYPVITGAARTVGGQAIIGGTLNSAPNTQYRIQLHFAVACHASGHGEGSFVAETTVTTNASGAASFNFALPSLPNGFVSATATDPNLNTSEFSVCVPVVTEDPSLTISDAFVTEGNAGTSVASFTVTLSPASQFTVSVNAQTSNGTAIAGSDYVAAGTTLTFAPGETTKQFAVTINGDTTVEPDETFTVTLSTPVNATVTDGQGTGTITNDDVAPAPTVNLSIAKQGPATATAGTNITWTITAANQGATAATGVTVTDVLPAGVAFVSATPSQGSCSGTSTVTCTLGTLSGGASATLTLVATAPSTPQTIANTATLTANETDTAPANNTSTSNVVIAPANVAAVPFLDGFGLAAIAGLLVALALLRLR